MDWEKDNHRKTVWKQLRRRFNAFHHELHKKYLSYDSHEEALASAPGMVGPLVWAKLCGRWGSEAFKVCLVFIAFCTNLIVTNKYDEGVVGSTAFSIETPHIKRFCFIGFYASRNPITLSGQ